MPRRVELLITPVHDALLSTDICSESTHHQKTTTPIVHISEQRQAQVRTGDQKRAEKWPENLRTALVRKPLFLGIGFRKFSRTL